MRFVEPLIAGTLLRRYHRFLADVRLAGGGVVTAHCPNSGSLWGCTAPGNPVLLSRASPRPGRRLGYTWELVRVGRTWVGVNTLRTNALAVEALEAGLWPELARHRLVRREVPLGSGTRLDLLLQGPRGPCYVEVKNVTARPDDGAAAFPDAVTERGLKHLHALTRLARAGHGAAVLFVVQRGDCHRFRPWDEVDPEYGRWLRRAAEAGVRALACRARAGPREVRPLAPLPVLL